LVCGDDVALKETSYGRHRRGSNVALRDFGLMLGAVALARLSEDYAGRATGPDQS